MLKIYYFCSIFRRATTSYAGVITSHYSKCMISGYQPARANNQRAGNTQAEIDYINKTTQDDFDNNNCKPFWGYVKAKKQDSVAPLKQKGNLFSESKGKAQILVEQFFSVFTQRKDRTLPNLKKCNKFDIPLLKR